MPWLPRNRAPANALAPQREGPARTQSRGRVGAGARRVLFPRISGPVNRAFGSGPEPQDVFADVARDVHRQDTRGDIVPIRRARQRCCEVICREHPVASGIGEKRDETPNERLLRTRSHAVNLVVVDDRSASGFGQLEDGLAAQTLNDRIRIV